MKKVKIAPRIIILALICIFLIIFFKCLFGSSKSTIAYLDRKIPIYNVDTNEKKIALTFDTSWGDDKTQEILDVLKKNNVKATFFAIGVWIDNFPKQAQEIYKCGNELANHSNMHPDFTKVSKAKIIEEIEIADNKIMKITGKMPKLVRCPSGSYNSDVISTVESTNHYCIQWDTDSVDWKNQDADTEYNRIMKKVKPGSILLFHTNGKNTPKNLQKIITNLKSQGYKFVTVSDLIYKNNYYINNEGTQIKK